MSLAIDEIETEVLADPEASAPSALREKPALVYIPVVIVLSGLLLWLYVSNVDMISQESTPLNWSKKLQPQIIQHIQLTVASTAIVLAVAIPTGIALTRPVARKFSPPVLWIANVGQSCPAYGLFVVAYMWIGRGFIPSVLALAFFSTLPVLRNTMVGIDQVDKAVIEAGRGMGLTRFQALRSIELPLAVPVMLAGVRTALIINVGMAALAFLIGGGGLGVTISAGLKLQQNLVIITGAALTAILALTIDWIAAMAEQFLRPKGLK